LYPARMRPQELMMPSIQPSSNPGGWCAPESDHYSRLSRQSPLPWFNLFVMHHE
jgi:hypothetical protein